MNEPAYEWKGALQRAIKKNRRDAHNRYLQLATVRPDNSPAVRTLVFRAFVEDASQLVMITDSRSAKREEVERNAKGEISWYFTNTRDQFRFRGSLMFMGEQATVRMTPDIEKSYPDADAELAGAGPDRQKIWAGLSNAAKEQFFWPAPGEPLEHESAEGLPPDLGQPPGNFLLLILNVHSVDHLSLRGQPQTRWISSLDNLGAWTSQAVNP
ncbi:MAG: pyridoxamine 5'-phosphate oxidase family protein [Pseudomonadota bacterium]